ncbi:MAG: histidine kinase [Phycisphaerae bacterium]|nr:histidine kinase [Phycisphaerae bacterium]MBM93074.1 histidine kinase [Phycisphaerae bacterium]|tara:strand:- start:111 stop:569 length:459 start_codon:yes stop_codon:yes gene_type:complete
MESVSTLNNETISGIQNLIEINIDSSEGFRTAADKVENTDIANMFRQCANEREQNAAQLRSIIQVNGETPEDSGTIKGTVHRWWLGLRGTVQQGDEHAVLAEAERGEDAIKHRYEDTLKETAGSAVNDVLQSQYTNVKSRHDQIRDMRDARA